LGNSMDAAVDTTWWVNVKMDAMTPSSLFIYLGPPTRSETLRMLADLQAFAESLRP
jgi:hypothetical protein